MEPTAKISRPSYSQGETTPELLPLCIGQVLDRTAERSPHRPALIVRQSNDRFTWAELRTAVEKVARGLMALGVGKGDRVGMWATNCTEWVLTQFATAKMGAVMVNLNPRYRSHELGYALRQSECQTLIMIRGFRDIDYVETLFEVAPELRDGRPGALSSPKLPHLSRLVFVGDAPPAPMLAWNDLVAMAEKISEQQLHEREAALSPQDPINIQYTSGTTGMPKGATLSHRNVVNNGMLIGNCEKLTDRDSICIPVPFYHCFGMVLANMACLSSGAAMVVPSAYFDPLETLATVQEERCTALYGVPTMFIAELNHPEFKRFDLSSLRTGIMAGSNCPMELMRQVTQQMHCSELTIAYGLTEASPVISQTRTDDSLEIRVGSVGRALPHTEIKIIEPQTGVIVPRETTGELCTRGYLVMTGYYNDPQATAKTLESDGWLHTGDLATMDENGYVRIAGRIKDIIIRGGENISPREIEEFLLTCPAIADVQIIGVPDPKFGEEVMAWVVLKAAATMTAEEVKQFCRGKIARYKIPRYVRFVDSFPMTVSGKVQKFLMRQISAAELAAAHPVSPQPAGPMAQAQASD
jgi:fatty-acyl-CoA synthase